MQKSVVRIWKQSIQRSGMKGVLHLVSVQEPSLTNTEGTETTTHTLVIGGFSSKRRKVPSSFRIWRRHRVRQKVMRTCEPIMDTAEPGTSADTEKPTTSSFVEVRDFLCSTEVAISALLRIKCYT